MSAAGAIDRCLARIGRAGIAGFGLGAFALGCWLSFVQPARDELAALKSRPARAAPGGPGTPTEAGAGTTALFELLPPVASLPDLVGALNSLAAKEGVGLDKADGKMGRAEGRLLAYELTLPVRGDYAGIRRFLAGVLNTMPFVSLDALAVTRQQAGSGVVEAQLRLTFFLESAAARPGRASSREPSAGARP